MATIQYNIRIIKKTASAVFFGVNDVFFVGATLAVALVKIHIIGRATARVAPTNGEWGIFVCTGRRL